MSLARHNLDDNGTSLQIWRPEKWKSLRACLPYNRRFSAYFYHVEPPPKAMVSFNLSTILNQSLQICSWTESATGFLNWFAWVITRCCTHLFLASWRLWVFSCGHGRWPYSSPINGPCFYLGQVSHCQHPRDLKTLCWCLSACRK